MSERLEDVASGEAGRPTKGFDAWIAGRARRREYWAWIAPLMILVFILGAAQLGGAGLLASVPILLIWIRRLHDLGYSGWIAPLINIGTAFVVFICSGFGDVGALVGYLLAFAPMILLGVLPGEVGANQYGPRPGTKAVAETFD